MNAFVTGSRKYGKPRPDSDVDLVVLMSYDEIVTLRKFKDKAEEGSTDDHATIRFGRLNIIALSDPNEFAMWKSGTLTLAHSRVKSGKPVSHEEACKFFEELFLSAGIEMEGRSG